MSPTLQNAPIVEAAAPLKTPPQRATLRVAIDARPYFRWKYRAERLLAVMLLLPALPLIAILALAVRASSRGPGIYRQRRLGVAGREFTIYKIRTMRHDAEVGSGPVWASPNDDRATPLGRVLRKTHLDELPQLWNVARGDMALIGPRPERPEIVERLAGHIPDFVNRLAVMPGISGLAQINLPPDSDLASTRAKLALDLRYIAEANPALDLRILAWTALRMAGLSASTLTRWMRLHRDPASPAHGRRRRAPGKPR